MQLCRQRTAMQTWRMRMKILHRPLTRRRRTQPEALSQAVSEVAETASAAVESVAEDAAGVVADAADAASETVESVTEEAVEAVEEATDTAIEAVEAAVATATGGAAGDAAAVVATAEGEAAYNGACLACHAYGAAGAPIVGNAEAWAPRIAKGMDALYASGINGVAGTGMIAKGGRPDLSDDVVKAAVDYMVANSR